MKAKISEIDRLIAAAAGLRPDPRWSAAFRERRYRHVVAWRDEKEWPWQKIAGRLHVTLNRARTIYADAKARSNGETK